MLDRLRQIKFRYLFSKSYVRTLTGAELHIDPTAKISRSRMVIGPEAKVTIGADVRIANACIFINKGHLVIEDNTLIGNPHSKLSIYILDGDCILKHHSIIGDARKESAITIEQGSLSLGAYSKFAGSLAWIRFGGSLDIGEYTNINHSTEIRCDEKITIGSYCQISYNIRIWDTNTHEILSTEERRKRTIDYFPIYGKELNRPKTKPIAIGNDCWIGEYCSILKGCQIGDECIVGFHTTLLGKQIPAGKKVFNVLKTEII